MSADTLGPLPSASGSQRPVRPSRPAKPPSYTSFREGPPMYTPPRGDALDELVAAGWPRRKAAAALKQYPDLFTAKAFLEHQRHWSWQARMFTGPDEGCAFCREIERGILESERREYELRRDKGRVRSTWRKENVYPKFEAATEVVAGTFAVPFYLVHLAREKRQARHAVPDEWGPDDY